MGNEEEQEEDQTFVGRLLQLGTIISGFANELTDVMYYSKVPFTSDTLETIHLVFLLLRPGLILIFWVYALAKMKSYKWEERLIFPLIIYFSVSKWLPGYNKISLLSSLLEVVAYQIPLLTVQSVNNTIQARWDALEVTSLIFTLFAMFIDIISLIKEIYEYRREQKAKLQIKPKKSQSQTSSTKCGSGTDHKMITTPGDQITKGGKEKLQLKRHSDMDVQRFHQQCGPFDQSNMHRQISRSSSFKASDAIMNQLKKPRKSQVNLIKHAVTMNYYAQGVPIQEESNDEDSINSSKEVPLSVLQPQNNNFVTDKMTVRENSNKEDSPETLKFNRSIKEQASELNNRQEEQKLEESKQDVDSKKMSFQEQSIKEEEIKKINADLQILNLQKKLEKLKKFKFGIKKNNQQEKQQDEKPPDQQVSNAKFKLPLINTEQLLKKKKTIIMDFKKIDLIEAAEMKKKIEETETPAFGKNKVDPHKQDFPSFNIKGQSSHSNREINKSQIKDKTPQNSNRKGVEEVKQPTKKQEYQKIQEESKNDHKKQNDQDAQEQAEEEEYYDEEAVEIDDYDQEETKRKEEQKLQEQRPITPNVIEKEIMQNTIQDLERQIKRISQVLAQQEQQQSSRKRIDSQRNLLDNDYDFHLNAKPPEDEADFDDRKTPQGVPDTVTHEHHDEDDEHHEHEDKEVTVKQIARRQCLIAYVCSFSATILFLLSCILLTQLLDTNECGTGYYRNSSLCKPCSVAIDKCDICTNDGKICQVCEDGYGAVSDSCQSCDIIPNCQSCSSAYGKLKCDQCNEDYAILDGKCNKCTSGCQTCSYIDDGTFSCSACKSGYGLGQQGLCQACTIDFCLKCDNNQSQCSSCSSPYTMKNNQCFLKCDQLQACSICTNTNNILKCIECNNPSYNDLSNNQCNLNCSKIDSQCSQCGQTEDTVYCTKCLDRYGLTSNMSCGLCKDSNCKNCNSNTSICNECYAPYTLSQSGTCVLNCSSIANCTQCSNNQGTIQCQACSSQFNLINNKCSLQCSVISEGCTNCTETPQRNCTKCASSYRLTRSVTTNISTCERCNELKCQNCDGSAALCTQCQAPFHSNMGSCILTCEEVPQCSTCSMQPNLQCTSCKNGYGLWFEETNITSSYCKSCNSTPQNCPYDVQTIKFTDQWWVIGNEITAYFNFEAYDGGPNIDKVPNYVFRFYKFPYSDPTDSTIKYAYMISAKTQSYQGHYLQGNCTLSRPYSRGTNVNATDGQLLWIFKPVSGQAYTYKIYNAYTAQYCTTKQYIRASYSVLSTNAQLTSPDQATQFIIGDLPVA